MLAGQLPGNIMTSTARREVTISCRPVAGLPYAGDLWTAAERVDGFSIAFNATAVLDGCKRSAASYIHPITFKQDPSIDISNTTALACTESTAAVATFNYIAHGATSLVFTAEAVFRDGIKSVCRTYGKQGQQAVARQYAIPGGSMFAESMMCDACSCNVQCYKPLGLFPVSCVM